MGSVPDRAKPKGLQHSRTHYRDHSYELRSTRSKAKTNRQTRLPCHSYPMANKAMIPGGYKKNRRKGK